MTLGKTYNITFCPGAVFQVKATVVLPYPNSLFIRILMRVISTNITSVKMTGDASSWAWFNEPKYCRPIWHSVWHMVCCQVYYALYDLFSLRVSGVIPPWRKAWFYISNTTLHVLQLMIPNTIHSTVTGTCFSNPQSQELCTIFTYYFVFTHIFEDYNTDLSAYQ